MSPTDRVRPGVSIPGVSRAESLALRLRAPPPPPVVAPRAPPGLEAIESPGTNAASSNADACRFLGRGLLRAPVCALPIVSFMGWCLAALVHEMGHASVAWLCGMPAIPAISLAGHAAAVHSERVLPLVFLIAALLVFA